MLGENKNIVLMMRDGNGNHRRVRVIERGQEKGWYVLEEKRARAEEWETLKKYSPGDEIAAVDDCINWIDESA